MEGVDSLYTETPEEETPAEEEQQPFQLATVATVEADGLTLTLDGAEEPTEKHYKCNTAVKFAAGQRVAVLELSGSKVVMFAVGSPGADAAAGIPSGGSTGQVLMKASGEDYALKWGTVAGIPSGGTTGQVLRKSSNNDYAVEWGSVGTLPSGGTAGQVLKKSSATDYAVTWGSPDGMLPTGGTAGQVLKKSSASNYACAWGDVSGTLPSGGSTGQVLKKSSGTDYAVTWGSPDGMLPTGGTDGQVLLKNGSSNYSAKWGTVSPTVAALTSGSYKLTLSSRTLTPSATGFEIGTSNYPVKVRGNEIVLYNSSYRYCTLACNSSGKLTVNGTAIN